MSSSSAIERRDNVLRVIQERLKSSISIADRARLSPKERRQLEGLDYGEHEIARFDQVHALMRDDFKARGIYNSITFDKRSEQEKNYRGWQSGRTESEDERTDRLCLLKNAIFGSIERNKRWLREQKKDKELEKLRDLEKLLEQVLKKLNWLYPVPNANYKSVPIMESHSDILPRIRGMFDINADSFILTPSSAWSESATIPLSYRILGRNEKHEWP